MVESLEATWGKTLLSGVGARQGHPRAPSCAIPCDGPSAGCWSSGLEVGLQSGIWPSGSLRPVSSRAKACDWLCSVAPTSDEEAHCYFVAWAHIYRTLLGSILTTSRHSATCSFGSMLPRMATTLGQAIGSMKQLLDLGALRRQKSIVV